jgi:hypothetical protein
LSVVLTPGSRFRSQVCNTEVVAVRAPGTDIDLQCGGTVMIPADSDPGLNGTPADGFAGGTLLGKRYTALDASVELLCVKAGEGALSVGATILQPAAAKPLPSSD